MKTKLLNIQLRPFTNQATGETLPAPLMDALAELLRRPVPPRTGLKIRNIVRAINQQATDVEAERVRLLEQHAKRDETGEIVYQDEAKTVFSVNGNFASEFNELMGLEFEVEALVASELDNIGQVTGQTLLNLDNLLVDDVTPKEEAQPENTTKAEAVVKRKTRRRG